ncbi:hypothetical protein SAMN05192574_11163 [Mucilaginibacter gossypiicola]|uniref:Uncharacterized protein n=1 Tax=Mucilaginibacter gossypiicola TaxID=551995 RepID=A0A1H8RWS6_9SPHI|nr:hypothetical protein [Mucilaginibacter gossypiicola]SEO70815.1 hypothetical protein SAMN05192574_11163 [Mucilaginibacter gossypiicola]
MDEELKRKAYLQASRLKNEGLDNEVIYARLEKQGIPPELIKQVLTNLTAQKIIDVNSAQKPFFNLALLKIGIGVLLAIVSMVVLPGQVILPIGLIAGGIITAVIKRPR